MDLREIADAFSGTGNDVTTGSPSPNCTLRKGRVISGGGTVNASVSIGGGAAVPVFFPKFAPANNIACWILQQESLLLGLF